MSLIKVAVATCCLIAYCKGMGVLYPATVHRTPQPVPSNAEGRPDIYSMNVESHIKYRYAVTKISSRVANPANISQQVHFKIFLPDTAFINSFQMIINGKEYKSFIKEKQQAKKEYQEAVNSGQSAGHIAVKARDSKEFLVSVNVEAGGKADFQLIYEEFLTRTLGLYSYVLNLSPGQVIRNYTIDVFIIETANIKKLIVPELHSSNQIINPQQVKNNMYAGIKTKKKNKAHIRFAPTLEQQAEMLNVGEKDWAGQFSVLYDVDHSVNPGGQVLVNDGYFVHFFSPENLESLNTYTVFVLDISGSMEGRKLEQLKDAMSTILDQLSPTDYFNIIDFSSSVTVHNLDSVTESVVVPPDTSLRADDFQEKDLDTPNAYPASRKYIEKAKQIIQKMSPLGGTNIHDALKNSLLVAQRSLESIQEKITTNTPIEPIILFLTDGDPTVGYTSHKKIINMVREVNKNKCAIFSLGFGEGADMNFLRKISLSNNGFARTIYEAADAALQLDNFYKQIASPLLTNVTFTYIPGQVTEKSLTKNTFQSLFLGSELVVAGQLTEDTDDFTGSIDALSTQGSTTFKSTRNTLDDIDEIELIDTKEDQVEDRSKPDKPVKKTRFNLERLWAYLTIKQLIDKYEAITENNCTLGKTLENHVISMALKYKFVTPLTSLVVVKPNETSTLSTDPVTATTVDKIGNFGLQSILPVMGNSNKDEISDIVDENSSNNRLLNERFDEDIDDEEEVDDYTEHLQWLPSVLQKDKTIKLPRGNNTKNFKLLDRPDNSTFGLCEVSSSLGGVQGVCVHLIQCITSEVAISLQTYMNYFCELPDEYAGVCCLDDNLLNKTDTTQRPGHFLLQF